MELFSSFISSIKFLFKVTSRLIFLFNSLIIIFIFDIFFNIFVKVFSNFSFLWINSCSLWACSLFINSFFSFSSISFFFFAFSFSNCSIFSFIIFSWFILSFSNFSFSAFWFISFNCNWYSSTFFLNSSSISFSFFEYSSSKSFFNKSISSLSFFSFSSISFLFAASISFCNSICVLSQSISNISLLSLFFIYNNIVFVPKTILSFVFKICPSSFIFFPLIKI